MTTAFQKYGQAPWHVPVGEWSEKDHAPKLADQPATVAVIKDSPDRTPAPAMLFEYAADNDAWAVGGFTLAGRATATSARNAGSW
ncbi:MAG: hypothetical protein AB7O62_24565 [Pirellulales bacterium]